MVMPLPFHCLFYSPLLISPAASKPIVLLVSTEAIVPTVASTPDSNLSGTMYGEILL